GLTHLSRAQLRQLVGTQRGNVGSPQQRADICNHPIQIALVGWQMYSFRSRPSELFARTVENIITSQQIYELEIDNIVVWKPSEETMERILYCANNMYTITTQQMILSTFEKSHSNIVDYQNGVWEDARQVDDVATATRMLQQFIKGSRVEHYTSSEVAASLDRYLAAYDQSACQKLLMKAEASSNPLAMTLAIPVVEMMERLVRTSPLVQEAKKVMRRDYREPQDEIDCEEQKQRNMNIDKLSQLTRQLKPLLDD
ncbi:MAG: hypothetical protein N2C12_00940, partial [Planctomycetales bacterium]